MALEQHWKTEPLAERLGISADDLLHAAGEGELHPLRIGRSVIWSEPEVRQWLERRGVTGRRETNIYFIREDWSGLIKIGHSTNPARRIQYHQAGNPRALTLLGWFPARVFDERELHKRFADSRYGGEWFRPSTELLDLVEERCA